MNISTLLLVSHLHTLHIHIHSCLVGTLFMHSSVHFYPSVFYFYFSSSPLYDNELCKFNAHIKTIVIFCFLFSTSFCFIDGKFIEACKWCAMIARTPCKADVEYDFYTNRFSFKLCFPSGFHFEYFYTSYNNFLFM